MIQFCESMRKSKSHSSKEIRFQAYEVLEQLNGALISTNGHYGNEPLVETLRILREQVLNLTAITCPH